jgi:hypothetical protein
MIFLLIVSREPPSRQESFEVSLERLNHRVRDAQRTPQDLDDKSEAAEHAPDDRARRDQQHAQDRAAVRYGLCATRLTFPVLAHGFVYLLAIAVPRKPFGSSQSLLRERLWIDNGREQPRVTIFLNVSPSFLAL